MAERVDSRPLDLYHLLQVSPHAEGEVIEAAYRALMKKHAPRTGFDSEEIAKQLNHARDVLTQAELRERYDARASVGAKNGVMVGNYRLLESIASGCVGDTYKAEHVELGELVCVKHCTRISSVAEEILRLEAKSVWDMRHYALPAMRDFLKLEDKTIALVMSYIPGPTLAEIVEKNKRMDAETACWITERILNALSYMHSHGVVHGDIKPQNIIIQPSKHAAVLVDFGLAMKNPTGASRSKGFTEHFAPPEQLDPIGVPLLPESDFYGLGTTMIYALSGSMARVKAREIPADTPEPVSKLIASFIRKDVLARPNWEKEDLCETIRQIREQAFGRTRSGMKVIPNFS